ncbi:MAG: toxin [Bacteroidota bacterium]
MQLIVDMIVPANIEDIEYFLLAFQRKRTERGMVYLSRDKNFQAMLDLEISAVQRDRVIDSLRLKHYYKGPHEDGVRPGSEYWEFGAKVKGKEVYIKLAIGLEDGPVLCFSFHAAERKITYPYRNH